jgi:hypothetical protein
MVSGKLASDVETYSGNSLRASNIFLDAFILLSKAQKNIAHLYSIMYVVQSVDIVEWLGD